MKIKFNKFPTPKAVRLDSLSVGEWFTHDIDCNDPYLYQVIQVQSKIYTFRPLDKDGISLVSQTGSLSWSNGYTLVYRVHLEATATLVLE